MNNNELTDMLQVYFECLKNSYDAARVYRNRYPNRNHPSHQKFGRLEANLRQFGSFKKPKKQQREFDADLELNVLLSVQETPRTSTIKIANDFGTSRRTVLSILKKHKYTPYVPRKIHALEHDNDRERRAHFCNIFLNRFNQDPAFYRKIMWSDECTFGRNGIFNRRNHRCWSQENPHCNVETNFQTRFSLNVWCGILDDMLVGPFFIDGSLDQYKYFELLTGYIENFLDQLPLANRYEVIFQQDGAPPHNTRLNVTYLNTHFGERWIGTNGPIRWPPRSPDLTVMDFFLWGYLKDQVYLFQPENIEILRHRILEACRNIPREFLHNATFSVVRRYQQCIAQNGGQFEHLL